MDQDFVLSLTPVTLNNRLGYPKLIHAVTNRIDGLLHGLFSVSLSLLGLELQCICVRHFPRSRNDVPFRMQVRKQLLEFRVLRGIHADDRELIHLSADKLLKGNVPVAIS